MKEIKFADFDSTELKGTPHCKKHGAMNKMTKFENGSGIWRCISVTNDRGQTVCRSGCQY